MRLLNVLVLAAFTALVALAFVGVSTASAEPDEITICKKLVTGKELCSSGQLAPKTTALLLLAKEPKLITNSGTVLCEDGVMVAGVESEVASPLPIQIFADFGVLPTPTLGSGCKMCTGGIHTNAGGYAGAIEVTGVDEFWVKTSMGMKFLNCFGFLLCEYGEENLKFKIDRDSTVHPDLSNAKGDLVLVHNSLAKTGGSGLCPASGIWEASYTVTGCALPGGGVVDCWIALDNK